MTDSTLNANLTNVITCPHCGKSIAGDMRALPGAVVVAAPAGDLAMMPDICPCPVCGYQLHQYVDQKLGKYWCDSCNADRDVCAGVEPQKIAPQGGEPFAMNHGVDDSGEEHGTFVLATRDEFTKSERAGNDFDAFIEAENPTDDELYGTDAHALDEPPGEK